MASIDGLFEQIIHYEKTAQERKNFLQDLKQAVTSAQENGRVLEKKYADLQVKLAQKVGELCDQELICKWLSSQEVIHQEQLSDLEKQLKAAEEEKIDVTKMLQEEKEKFCADISQFYINFGPRSSCGIERKGKFASMFQALQMEKAELKSKQEKYSIKEEAVKKLCTEKENLKRQLENIFLENNKLTSSMCEELQKSADLEEEKQKVTQLPTTDPSFISIQEELDSERQVSSNLEEKYSQVQSQLHQLHQKLWQQQLQQQQHGKQPNIKRVGKIIQSGQPSSGQERKNMGKEEQRWPQKSDLFKCKMKVSTQTSNTNAGSRKERTEFAVSSYKGNSQDNSNTGIGMEEYDDMLLGDDENLSDDIRFSQSDKFTM